MLIVGNIHSFLLYHSQCFLIVSENRVPLKYLIWNQLFLNKLEY